jgi:hypothetical protein
MSQIVDKISGTIDPTAPAPYSWFGTGETLHSAGGTDEQDMSEHGYNLDMGRGLHAGRPASLSGFLPAHEQDDDCEGSYTSNLPPPASGEFDGAMAPPSVPDAGTSKLFAKRTVSDAEISPPLTTTVSESSKRSSKRVNLGPPTAYISYPVNLGSPTSDTLYEKTWDIFLVGFLQSPFEPYPDLNLVPFFETAKNQLRIEYPGFPVPGAYSCPSHETFSY